MTAAMYWGAALIWIGGTVFGAAVGAAICITAYSKARR